MEIYLHGTIVFYSMRTVHGSQILTGYKSSIYNAEFRSFLSARQADAVASYVHYLSELDQNDEFFSVVNAKNAYDSIWKDLRLLAQIRR